MADFYDKVPTTLADNLEYRLKLRTRAGQDAGFRRACLAACKHDVLFFFSAWCYLYEPRPKIINGKKQSNIIPFIPWPHQVPVIQEIDKLLGFDDIGLEKSRTEGASWISILFAVRDWLFVDMSAVGFVSRNEKSADNPDDPDSLFSKVDFELTKLPKWMVPPFKRNLADHTLKNQQNGSTITAYSATGDVGTGGRKSWFLQDELAKFKPGEDYNAMASTQHVTNSRLIVSTPKGRTGAYYDIMHDDSNMKKLTLRWQDNPTKNRGLYELKDGLPVAVDPVNNPLPKSYNPPTPEVIDMLQRLKRKGFELDGKLRSPWYDHECDRAASTPQKIAQELDRDYGGSVALFFREDFFKEAEATVRPPLNKGMIDYSTEDLEPTFEKSREGDLLLWCPLDVDGKPPVSSYVVSCDPSYGLGGAFTNNSGLCVIDQLSMEQVGEFAIHTMPPEDFADFAIAICKLFHNAFLIWEAQGPGFGFAKRVLQRGYGNVYRRTDEQVTSKKASKKVGWWSSPDSKAALFGDFKKAVRMGELKLHSDALVKECTQYVIIDGVLRNSSAAYSEDDLSAKHSHADRVVAAALGRKAARERPLFKKSDEEGGDPNKAPYGSLAWRNKFHQDKERDDGNPWDERTNDDLAGGERRCEVLYDLGRN
jgi:hypothetical protein